MAIDRRKLRDIFLQNNVSSVDVVKARELLAQLRKEKDPKRYELTEEVKNTHYGIDDGIY